MFCCYCGATTLWIYKHSNIYINSKIVLHCYINWCLLCRSIYVIDSQNCLPFHLYLLISACFWVSRWGHVCGGGRDALMLDVWWWARWFEVGCFKYAIVIWSLSLILPLPAFPIVLWSVTSESPGLYTCTNLCMCLHDSIHINM